LLIKRKSLSSNKKPVQKRIEITMSLIAIRKRSLIIESQFHEGGPTLETPLKLAAACAVIKNPYAGRYEANLLPFMAELRTLGTLLANELIETLGAKNVQVYGKGAIVGVNGELEHGAVWHEAGGWAMRAVLGEPKALVPASKAVAACGYRLMIPVHNIHACYVRGHFNGMEVGIQDSPRPDEILYALVMGSGSRVHSRLGGLTPENISVHDGQR
jgi:Amino acid synthesis